MTTVAFLVAIALILLALAYTLRMLLPRSAPGWLGRRIGALYCRLWHGETYWPIHSRYRCKVCHRETAVRWDGKEIA